MKCKKLLCSLFSVILISQSFQTLNAWDQNDLRNTKFQASLNRNCTLSAPLIEDFCKTNNINKGRTLRDHSLMFYLISLNAIDLALAGTKNDEADKILLQNLYIKQKIKSLASSANICDQHDILSDAKNMFEYLISEHLTQSRSKLGTYVHSCWKSLALDA